MKHSIQNIAPFLLKFYDLIQQILILGTLKQHQIYFRTNQAKFFQQMRTNSSPSIKDILTKQNHQTSISQLRKTQSILFQNYQNKLVFKKIVLPAETLNEQIKIYEWRNNIQKGIAHCLWTCIMPLDRKNVLIELKNKLYPYTLHDIGKISLTQLIHILKQILIGLQILYNKFGGFYIDEECIFIDQNFQIQVWVSKQPSSNIFNLKQQSQHQFLCSILKLMQSHEIRSNLSKNFNQGLYRYEELTFSILKGYIENFITQKQLIIGSQKSVRQIFMYPKGIKQIKDNHDKNVKKNCSLKFISNSENQLIPPKSDRQIFSPKNDQKQTNLQFSSSRKIRRKGPNVMVSCSVKVLKDSDMTTEETQNLSGSRDNNHYRGDNSKEKTPMCNFALEGVVSRFKLGKSLDKRLKKTQADQKDGLKQDFQMIQINQIQRLPISSNRKPDSLDIYTRDALSERQNEVKLTFEEESQYGSNPKTTNRNPQKHSSSYSSKEQQQSQPQIDLILFKQKLRSNFKIFDTIDSLADTKNMTNSIQIQDEKRKKSPIRLQKLSSIKTKLYESIMEEDFHAAKINQQLYSSQQ